jgi:hypothetical protein
MEMAAQAQAGASSAGGSAAVPCREGAQGSQAGGLGAIAAAAGGGAGASAGGAAAGDEDGAGASPQVDQVRRARLRSNQAQASGHVLGYACLSWCFGTCMRLCGWPCAQDVGSARWDLLPEDCRRHVFSFLGSRDMARAARACRELAAAARSLRMAARHVQARGECCCPRNPGIHGLELCDVYYIYYIYYYILYTM